MSTTGGGAGSDDDALDTIVVTGPRLDEDHALTRGHVIGRYHVLEEIGRGGMGRVLRAYDPKLQREVAIKLLRKTTDAAARQQIETEARVMARLAHPNIVAVYDVEDHGDAVFIVMELVRGQTLRAALASERRPWRELLRTFIAAGRGLAAAHQAGIVHLDFKPANVLIGADGRVRVTDFGIARALGIEATGREGSPSPDSSLVTGAVMGGTPAYMAPEQRAGEEVDARADQFAFCVALWEGLFGKRPFKRPEAVLESPPVAPSRDVPGWLVDVVRRGLSPRPNDRFASMADLVTALASDPAPRRRRIAIAVGALGLVGLAAGAIEWSERRKAEACRVAGEAIADRFDDEDRSAIEAALVAHAGAYADDTWQRVEAALDTWTAAWSGARTEVCRAMGIERSLTPDLGELAVRCLDSRAAELGGIVEVLATADTALAQRAVVTARSLADPAECLDTTRLIRAASPPDDEEVAAAAALLRRDLTRLDARASATTEDLAADFEHALQRARDTAYPPLEAEALYTYGEYLMRRDVHGDAANKLAEAYHLAGRHRHDVVAAAAATQLVTIHGHDLGDPNSGLAWGRHAEMMVERAGIGRSRTAMVLGEAIGTLHRSADRFEEAQAYYDAALALSEEVFGADHPETARTLRALGILAFEQGKKAEAHDYFLRSRDMLERALGPDHPSTAVSWEAVANSLADMHRTDEAIVAYEKVLAIYEAAYGPRHGSIAGSLDNYARALASAGRLEEAGAANARALELLREIYGDVHPEVALGWNMRGNLGLARHRYDEALAAFDEAGRVYEATLGQDHSAVAGVAFNRGLTLRYLGRLDEAREAYRRSLAIRERALPPGHQDILFARLGVAALQIDAGDAESAYATCTAIGRELEAAPHHGGTPPAEALTCIGSAALALERYPEAAAALEQALERIEGGHSHTPFHVAVLWELARARWQLGEREAARRHAARALELRKMLPGASVPTVDRLRAWIEAHPP